MKNRLPFKSIISLFSFFILFLNFSVFGQTISLDQTSLDFGNIQVGNTSILQYTVSGSGLTTPGVLTIKPPVGFDISSDGGGTWYTNTNPVTLLIGGDGTINGQPITIKVRFSPTSPCNPSGNVNHLDDGSHSADLPVSGTGTAIQVPTVQASNIIITNKTVNSITFNWTDGDGFKRAIFIKQTNSGSAIPVDGQTYNPNLDLISHGDQIGSTGWYCVYNDNTSHTGGITVTGLSSGADYQIMICEYNGNPGYQKYNTSTVTDNPKTVKTTYAYPSTQASNVIFSGVTSSQMTINWTDGTNGSYVAVFMKATNIEDAVPINNTTYTIGTDFSNHTPGSQIETTGWYCVYNNDHGSHSSGVTVNGLQPGTVYRVMVINYNGSVGSEAYNVGEATNNPNNQTTSMAAPSGAIDYTTEKITNIDNTMEYTIDNWTTKTDVTGTEVDLKTLTGFGNTTLTLKIRVKVGPGAEQTLTINPRPAAPAAHTINYTTEQTGEVVPPTQEYATDNVFTAGLTTGTGVVITVTPGTDLWFRVKAVAGTSFASNGVQLVVASRPVTPAAHTINYTAEQTGEMVSTTQEYATNNIFTAGLTTGTGTVVTVTPGTDLWFRVKAVAGTSFASTGVQLVVPSRPAAPTHTIDYVLEKTGEVVPTTEEHATDALFTLNRTDGTGFTIGITPGTNLYFRVKQSGNNFAGMIETLIVTGRPAAPTHTIDYVLEKTGEVIPTTEEHATDALFTLNRTDGTGFTIGVTPGTNLYFRVKQSGNNFAGTTETLIVAARPAAPTAHTIDYVLEKTGEAIQTAEEYATNAGFTAGLTTGEGAMITLTPGQDIWLRVKAVVGLSFASTGVQLVVASRPVASAAHTINYTTEQTGEVVPATQEYATNNIFTAGLTTGTGAVITVIPGTDMWFRVKAMAGTSFASTGVQLIVKSRTAAPTHTINYVTEQTGEVIPATVEYATNAGFTVNRADGTEVAIGVTPGTNLYFRVKQSGNNFSGSIQTLAVIARPAAPAHTINYVTEQTGEVVPTTEEYVENAGFTINRSDGMGVPIGVVPGINLYFRVKQSGNNFSGSIQTLVVATRPAAPPAHTIDYVLEKTGEAVPLTEEYAADAGFTAGLTTGAASTINLNPGQDIWFRVKAVVNTSFASTGVQLVVASRPVAPAAHTINYTTEQIGEVVPANQEYATSNTFTAGLTTGTGVVINLIPGTNIWFRVKAVVNTSFASTGVQLVVASRPLAPTAGDGSGTTMKVEKSAGIGTKITSQATTEVQIVEANGTTVRVPWEAGTASGKDFGNAIVTDKIQGRIKATGNAFASANLEIVLDASNCTIAASVVPTVLSVRTNISGDTIRIRFDKPMSNPSGKHIQFSVLGSGSYTVTAAVLDNDNQNIRLSVNPIITSAENLYIIYNPGDITSAEGGNLNSFNLHITNFVGVTNTLSGTIKIFPAGTPLAGVYIRLNSGASPFSIIGETSTSNDGTYIFPVTAGNSYYILLSKDGYYFADEGTPNNYYGQSKLINTVASGDPIMNIAATQTVHTNLVSGRVRDASTNSPISGATITVTGIQCSAVNLLATTNQYGDYSVPIIQGASFQISITHPSGYKSGSGGYAVFNPVFDFPNSDFYELPVSLTGCGVIYGKVTKEGSALSGVTITLSDASTATTDDKGIYCFAKPYNQSYTLTPSKTNYAFTPISLNLTIPDNFYVGFQDFTASLTQSTTISVQQGWNMISSFMNPQNPDLSTLLTNYNSKIVILKNGEGKVYAPQYLINQIGNWNYLNGYQIYVTSNESIIIQGIPIIPEATPVSLIQGWNMISYLRSSSMFIGSAISTIQSNLLIIKDGPGNVYYPSLSINQIGNMQPGCGYQVYMNQAGNLTYPANTLNVILNKIADDIKTKNVQRFYIPSVFNTGSNATLIVEGDLDNNDEVGVWNTKNILVGCGVFSEGKAVITIWGENPITDNVINGAITGENLKITIWQSKDQKEKNLKIKSVKDLLKNEEISKGLQYSKDAFWIAETEIEKNQSFKFSLSQNYPNPFNPSTIINYQIQTKSYVNLELFNTLGQKVKILVAKEQEPGSYDVLFDKSTLPSGIYYYRLTAGSLSETRKMLFVK